MSKFLCEYDNNTLQLKQKQKLIEHNGIT